MVEVEVRKFRSPPYPGISLETAVERASRLYERENRHEAAVPTVLTNWGYSLKSGPGFTTLSAVKQFGLISDSGRGDARRIRLSPLGLRIVQDRRPDSQERIQALKEAALQPTVYSDLWRVFGLDASDHNLAYHLETQGFSPSTAREVVEGYKATVSFAQLQRGDTVGAGEEEIGLGEEPQPELENPLGGQRGRLHRTPGMKTYAIPVDSDHDAVVEFPIPMTPARWENFTSFLTAMEKVIVRDQAPELSQPWLPDSPPELDP